MADRRKSVRLAQRGDILLIGGVEDVVRDVQVTLHLASGMPVTMPANKIVVQVEEVPIPQDVMAEVEEIVAADPEE